MLFKFFVFLEIILLFIHTTLFSFGDFIIDDFEIEKSTPTAINGTCGSSEAQGSITPPSSNLCSTGNATIVTSGTGSFTWLCNGVNGGSMSSCSAPRQYTLTFDANGGTLPIPLTKVVTYNNEIGILSTTTRDGYVFKGWFDSTIGGNQITQNTKILSDTTVYAQWDLSINGVCGTASSEATLTVPNTQLCASGTPSSVTSGTGSFTWSCTGQNGGLNSTCSTLRQYLLTYDSNGGIISNPETQKVIYNTEIGTLASTTRNGYTFQGWFDQKIGGTQILTTTKILADITVYAQWNQILSSGGSSGGGGGGGGQIVQQKDNCPTGDFSPTYYDGICGDIKKEAFLASKNEPISVPDTPSITDTKAPVEKTVAPIVENKKLKQCEENELVKARQCVFPKMNVFFSDIDDSFAKNYIQSLGNASIMQGYYDTTLFKPNNTISRAEYLKVLLRSFCIDYSKVVTYNISYTDVDKNAWEAKVVAKALELGVIDKSNSTFRPHQPVTRAEALKMIFQISGVVPKDAYITRFEDVDQSGWEVKYIQKANNMCVVDGYTIDGKVIFQPYKNMTRAEVAKVISNALQMN